MKDLSIGNIVKIKRNDTCVVVDLLEDEAIVFNITKMKPAKIKTKDIKEIIGKANCTTMVVGDKKITLKEKDEKDSTDSSEKQNLDNLKDNEGNNNPGEFGELIKAFGKAAISLGNILVDIAKEEENGEH